MQTIVTSTYVGPTNTKGSRLSVKSSHGRKMVGFDHAAPGWDGISPETVGEILKGMLAKGEHPFMVEIDSVNKVGGPASPDTSYYVVTYHEAE